MDKTKKVYLALSLDVEEEGLFCGRYRRVNPQVTNISAMGRLVPLLERGIKPTLFCAWSVFADVNACKTVDALRGKYELEIGAHLHHWNTPPLQDMPGMPDEVSQVPATSVPLDIMEAKLKTLFSLAGDYNGSPVKSFRMGRWDLHREIWPMLLYNGVQCDASVRPLHMSRHKNSNPDHFDAFHDPYLVKWEDGQILEIPLTVTPLHPLLAKIGGKGVIGKAHRSLLRKWGCLTLLPVEHPLWLMKLTTLMHVRRGGQVLSLTWHSSEMMPGGAPHMRDENSVSIFIKKIEAYFEWLEKSFDIRYETMSGIKNTLGNAVPVVEKNAGDWCFSS